jgi:hypothetical protein
MIELIKKTWRIPMLDMSGSDDVFIERCVGKGGSAGIHVHSLASEELKMRWLVKANFVVWLRKLADDIEKNDFE